MFTLNQLNNKNLERQEERFPFTSLLSSKPFSAYQQLKDKNKEFWGLFNDNGEMLLLLALEKNKLLKCGSDSKKCRSVKIHEIFSNEKTTKEHSLEFLVSNLLKDLFLRFQCLSFFVNKEKQYFIDFLKKHCFIITENGTNSHINLMSCRFRTYNASLEKKNKKQIKIKNMLLF